MVLSAKMFLNKIKRVIAGFNLPLVDDAKYPFVNSIIEQLDFSQDIYKDEDFYYWLKFRIFKETIDNKKSKLSLDAKINARFYGGDKRIEQDKEIQKAFKDKKKTLLAEENALRKEIVTLNQIKQKTPQQTLDLQNKEIELQKVLDKKKQLDDETPKNIYEVTMDKLLKKIDKGDAHFFPYDISMLRTYLPLMYDYFTRETENRKIYPSIKELLDIVKAEVSNKKNENKLIEFKSVDTEVSYFRNIAPKSYAISSTKDAKSIADKKFNLSYLAELSARYEICIGLEGSEYARKINEGKACALEIAPKNKAGHGLVIYIENGSIYEVKSYKNSVPGYEVSKQLSKVIKKMQEERTLTGTATRDLAAIAFFTKDMKNAQEIMAMRKTEKINFYKMCLALEPKDLEKYDLLHREIVKDIFNACMINPKCAELLALNHSLLECFLDTHCMQVDEVEELVETTVFGEFYYLSFHPSTYAKEHSGKHEAKVIRLWYACSYLRNDISRIKNDTHFDPAFFEQLGSRQLKKEYFCTKVRSINDDKYLEILRRYPTFIGSLHWKYDFLSPQYIKALTLAMQKYDGNKIDFIIANEEGYLLGDELKAFLSVIEDAEENSFTAKTIFDASKININFLKYIAPAIYSDILADGASRIYIIAAILESIKSLNGKKLNGLSEASELLGDMLNSKFGEFNAVKKIINKKDDAIKAKTTSSNLKNVKYITKILESDSADLHNKITQNQADKLLDIYSGDILSFQKQISKILHKGSQDKIEFILRIAAEKIKEQSLDIYLLSKNIDSNDAVLVKNKKIANILQLVRCLKESNKISIDKCFTSDIIEKIKDDYYFFHSIINKYANEEVVDLYYALKNLGTLEEEFQALHIDFHRTLLSYLNKIEFDAQTVGSGTITTDNEIKEAKEKANLFFGSFTIIDPKYAYSNFFDKLEEEQDVFEYCQQHLENMSYNELKNALKILPTDRLYKDFNSMQMTKLTSDYMRSGCAVYEILTENGYKTRKITSSRNKWMQIKEIIDSSSIRGKRTPGGARAQRAPRVTQEDVDNSDLL